MTRLQLAQHIYDTEVNAHGRWTPSTVVAVRVSKQLTTEIVMIDGRIVTVTGLFAMKLNTAEE